MINKLKNNTKIKVISFFCSAILWLYVMIVVDPSGRKVFEDIPVHINNMNEIIDKGLVIYPEEEFTANLEVEGKVSQIKKLKKEEIRIFGQINNPIEGNNEIELKSNISTQLDPDVKGNATTVRLEKIISKEKDILIDIDEKSKGTIDIESIEKDIESVNMTGPRSLVQNVNKVIAILDIGNNTEDFNTSLTIKPVDKNNNLIKGLKLDRSKIEVKVPLFKSKSVEIKPVFKENTNIPSFNLSQQKVVIKGKKDSIEKIGHINTKAISLEGIPEGSRKKVVLDIPDGVMSDIKDVDIIISEGNDLSNEFTYKYSDIELRNNIDNIGLDDLSIPEKIIINVLYANNNGNIVKEDIKLYIDLANMVGENSYKINYESKHNFKKIEISPNSVNFKI